MATPFGTWLLQSLDCSVLSFQQMQMQSTWASYLARLNNTADVSAWLHHGRTNWLILTKCYTRETDQSWAAVLVYIILNGNAGLVEVVRQVRPKPDHLYMRKGKWFGSGRQFSKLKSVMVNKYNTWFTTLVLSPHTCTAIIVHHSAIYLGHNQLAPITI